MEGSKERCDQLIYESVKKVNEILDANLVNGKVIEELRGLGTFIGLLTVAVDIPILGTIAEIERMLVEAISTKNRQRTCLVVVLITHVLKYSERNIIFKNNCTWFARILALLQEVYEANGTNVFVCLEIERFFEDLNNPAIPIRQFSSPPFPDAHQPQYAHYNTLMPGVTNTGPQLFLPLPPLLHYPLFYNPPVYFYFPV